MGPGLVFCIRFSGLINRAVGTLASGFSPNPAMAQWVGSHASEKTKDFATTPCNRRPRIRYDRAPTTTADQGPAKESTWQFSSAIPHRISRPRPPKAASASTTTSTGTGRCCSRHPKNFTPVCTTELGYTAKLKPEFDKRGVKVLGLSVDELENHAGWAADIDETQGSDAQLPADRRPRGRDRPQVRHDPSQCRQHADRALGVRHRAGQEGEAQDRVSGLDRPQLRRGPARHRQPAADRQAPGGDAGQLEERRGRDHRHRRLATRPPRRSSRTAGRRSSPISAIVPQPRG